MRTLRDFLYKEFKLNEETESSDPKLPPVGWIKGSTGGRISKEGLQIIRQFAQAENNEGKIVKYSQRTNIDVDRVIKNMGLDLGSNSSLGDILGLKGVMNPSSVGAKRLQLIFQSVDQSGSVAPGRGGYVFDLNPEWPQLAGRPKSSQKILMFWINTIYNIYKTGNPDDTQLRFFFKGDKMMVDEPK